MKKQSYALKQIMTKVNKDIYKSTSAFYKHNARKFGIEIPQIIDNFTKSKQIEEIKESNQVKKVTSMKTVKIPTEHEWRLIECSIYARKERNCPICMSMFGSHAQLVSSCRHTYHKQCYLQFLKNSPQQKNHCVVCRQEAVIIESPQLQNYNYKLTIIYIQSLIRGFIAIKARNALKCVSSGEFQTKFKQLSQMGNQVQENINIQFDQQVYQFQLQIEESNKIFDQFLKLQNQSVFQGIQKARQRQCVCCYICYEDLPKYNYIQFNEADDSEYYVMSCCGCIFHKDCISGAEMESNVYCCYCKQNYFKIPIILV